MSLTKEEIFYDIKKFYKNLYLLLIIFIISFFVTACSKSNYTGLNTAKIGISWAADKIDEDAQLYADAVKKAGGDDLNPELYG